MEAEQVRSRVAIALGLKLGVSNEHARIVGDTALRAIQECGLITLLASDLAKVNHLMSVGIAQNVSLREALTRAGRLIDSYGDPGDDEEFISTREMVHAALADPDDIVIEGELAKPAADA
jgi:hypothetical protein